jgi:hypothetical protein
MPTESSAIAKSLAAAETHLDALCVLSGILSSGIDRARRNLRQIRTDVAATPSQPQTGGAAASELGAEMLE